MQLGEIANPDALPNGKPLDGVRILALEQMQAAPYATQLLARLGADVVKIENPTNGDLGRGSLPAMLDPQGRRVGATFLRNNLGKRSVAIDLKTERGRRLVLDLVPHFDIVVENFKAGALHRLGLGYADVAAVYPAVIYVSVSGFGNAATPGEPPSPYGNWPAYASIAEAMSGMYEWSRQPGRPPKPSPMGALGDIGAALYATIGALAALRHRDRAGIGQHVDISMFDAMVAMGDVITNFWSMGERPEPGAPPKIILDGILATNGYFIVQVGRAHEFERLAELVGKPEWLSDPRLATPAGWRKHFEEVIRPGIEAWAAGKTNIEACYELSAAGIACGPVLTPSQVIEDPHVANRRMLVAMERTDGVPDPILVPGNPVKMSKTAEGPETRIPWLGEHTDEVLAAELGLSAADLASLRADGVIA